MTKLIKKIVFYSGLAVTKFNNDPGFHISSFFSGVYLLLIRHCSLYRRSDYVWISRITIKLVILLPHGGSSGGENDKH